MEPIKRAVLAISMLGCITVLAGSETSTAQSDAAESADGTATGLLPGKVTAETAMDKAWSAFHYMHHPDPGYQDKELDFNFYSSASSSFTATIGISLPNRCDKWAPPPIPRALPTSPPTLDSSTASTPSTAASSSP